MATAPPAFVALTTKVNVAPDEDVAPEGRYVVHAAVVRGEARRGERETPSVDWRSEPTRGGE